MTELRVSPQKKYTFYLTVCEALDYKYFSVLNLGFRQDLSLEYVRKSHANLIKRVFIRNQRERERERERERKRERERGLFSLI